MEKHNGFTFVELLVAMTMMTITMAGFYSVYRMQTRSLKSQDNRLKAQQDARITLEFMVREIRNVGYFPEKVTNANCFEDEGGIQIADSQSFRFHYDFQGDTPTSPADGNCGDANEDIAFGYNATTKDITRAMNGGVPQRLTDGNAYLLQLKYFTQTGTELTAVPLSAADRANIQRVTITVTIKSDNPDEFGGGQLIATIGSNVNLRNRGLL